MLLKEGGGGKDGLSLKQDRIFNNELSQYENDSVFK